MIKNAIKQMNSHNAKTVAAVAVTFIHHCAVLRR